MQALKLHFFNQHDTISDMLGKRKGGGDKQKLGMHLTHCPNKQWPRARNKLARPTSHTTHTQGVPRGSHTTGVSLCLEAALGSCSASS
jgi:hypothetical protein